MKALFCHDGPLSRDENGVYYGIAHNNEMFQRYKTLANEIRVVIRVKSVLASDADGKLSPLTLDNFTVVECPNLASIKGLLFNKIRLRSILKAEIEQADYVIARLPSHIGNMSISIAKTIGKPYLVEVVACPWDSLWNHSAKGKLVAPFMAYATKRRVRNSNYVIYVTKEFLQQRYPTKGKNISCSNVLLANANNEILTSRLNKIDSKGDTLVIGTAAAVDVRFKGQQYVIQALGKLKKQGQVCYEYQLVGSGDQSFLKSLAEQENVSKQVKFLGAMPHNKVFEWLDGIDIYVQPSRQEGLPRSLIEAMSRALPAFGAQTGGIPELLEQEYIFGNGRSNIDEICSILNKFDSVHMKEQAQRNYAESKKYDKKIIEQRRKEFFCKFKNDWKPQEK